MKKEDRPGEETQHQQQEPKQNMKAPSMVDQTLNKKRKRRLMFTQRNVIKKLYLDVMSCEEFILAYVLMYLKLYSWIDCAHRSESPLCLSFNMMLIELHQVLQRYQLVRLLYCLLNELKTQTIKSKTKVIRCGYCSSPHFVTRFAKSSTQST